MRNITMLSLSVLFVLLSFNTVLSSQKYCLNNETLYVEDSYYKVKNGESFNYVFNETKDCQYGCYNNTLLGASCNTSSYVNTLIIIGIFLFVVVLFVSVYAFTRRYL